MESVRFPRKTASMPTDRLTDRQTERERERGGEGKTDKTWM